jgi:hypothetical protein
MPSKSRFCQAATSIAKLAAANALLLPPPLPPRCHRHATIAYKIKEKYVILLTFLFFTSMVMAACSNDGRPTRQRP